MKKTIIWIVILIAILIAGFYALNSYIYHEKQGDSSTALTHKDVQVIVDGRLIKLENGVSVVEAVPDSESKIETRYFGNEVKKDLDGDGIEDVAYLITQNTGGSGTFYYAVAALKKADGYVGTNALLLGDRIAPQTTESGEGKTIVVNYADRKPGDSMAAAPSVGKSMILLLDPQSMSFGEVVKDFEGEADPSKLSLQMKPWTWTGAAYGDALLKPRDPKAFTITFSNDGRFSATTDCNSMGGAYTVNGSSIRLSDIFATKKFCENSQERDFSKVLSDIRSYSFNSKGELIFNLEVSGKATFR